VGVFDGVRVGLDVNVAVGVSVSGTGVCVAVTGIGVSVGGNRVGVTVGESTTVGEGWFDAEQPITPSDKHATNIIKIFWNIKIRI
jgi:hypothetical protein